MVYTKMSINMSDLVVFMLSVPFVGTYSEHLDSFIAPQGSQNSLDLRGELQHTARDL